MNNERLKDLLFYAIVRFAEDGYEKKCVLQALNMREEELEELIGDEDLRWTSYE